ncbi:MAG TPA: TIGR03560 family F420-dependent LLM class oxidoreductase [Acidimicrobiales bacterium]|nr:TIGR03560 family F420-dependent LLM class oxidoreductase [Acidimicrobiales bacterium]
MRFSVWPSPQRPWSDIREIVLHCDRSGWDGAYFADHFMPDDPAGQPVDGAVLECWAVLAALAAETRHLRLGSLVSGNLYRHPAVVAKAAATIDHISGGRLVVGLGAGWQVNEHAAYGIDLLDVGPRLDAFEEACAVITSLLRQRRTTIEGGRYRIMDAPCDPKPVQSRLPLLIGGGGEKRTMRIAARHADEWNAWGSPEDFSRRTGLLEGHCAAVGRDPSTIVRSTQALVYLSTDEAWLAPRRREDPGRSRLLGTPAELVEQVAAYEAVGVDELIVPDWMMGSARRSIDTLDLFWNEVAAPFR